jgi:hypothetical protein
MISSRRRDSRVLAIPNVYKYPSPQCLTLLSFFLPLLCCSLWVRPPGAGFYHPLRATSDGRAPRLLQIFQVSCTFGSVLVSRGVGGGVDGGVGFIAAFFFFEIEWMLQDRIV